jgi:hypothetical protein
MLDLKYELKKCKECSCSRCNLNGTNGCYIEVAIKEIERYEQAMDAVEKDKLSKQTSDDAYMYVDGTDPDSVRAAYYNKNF